MSLLRPIRSTCTLALLFLLGCGDDAPDLDAGGADATAPADGSSLDASNDALPPTDASDRDAGPDGVDSAVADGGDVDADGLDSGQTDGGETDAGDMDGGEMDADAGPLVGMLAAFVVQGLSYDTGTHSGTTSADGSFFYEEGERVRFFVGNVALGEVDAQPEITLFDLAGSERPMTRRAILEARYESQAYVRLIALAVFLASFDDDGDASDGVVLAPEIASLFDSSEIELTDLRVAGDFYRAFENAQAHFSSPHRIVLPQMAMKALYETAEIDPAIGARVRETYDRDNDGVIDDERHYAYDGNGFRTLSHRVIPASRIVGYTYAADGYELSNTYDLDQDGTVDLTYERTYNTSGLLIETVARESSGMTTERTSYTYDEAGREILMELDRDDDGNLDSATMKSYEGDSPLRTLEQLDSDGDGDFDRVVRFEWDAELRIVSEEVDEDGDGMVDSVSRYTYSPTETYSETDEDNDGTIDSFVRSELDSDGNVIRSESMGSSYHRIIVNEYDAAGNRTRQEQDQNADGSPDRITVWAWDQFGSVTMTQRDDDADGTFDSVSSCMTEYDTNDDAVSYACDTDEDTMVDYVETYELEPTGWGALEL